MNAYLEIIRPGNAIMAVIAVLLIAIISGIFTFKVLLGCIVVFIVTGAGNSIKLMQLTNPKDQSLQVEYL